MLQTHNVTSFHKSSQFSLRISLSAYVAIFQEKDFKCHRFCMHCVPFFIDLYLKGKIILTYCSLILNFLCLLSLIRVNRERNFYLNLIFNYNIYTNFLCEGNFWSYEEYIDKSECNFITFEIFLWLSLYINVLRPSRNRSLVRNMSKFLLK